MASVSRPGFQHTDLTLIPQMTLKANWLHLEPVNVTKYMEMGGGNRSCLLYTSDAADD